MNKPTNIIGAGFSVEFSLRIAYDLQLTVERDTDGSFQVWVQDSDSNTLLSIGAFHSTADALAALPVLTQTAIRLYPKHADGSIW